MKILEVKTALKDYPIYIDHSYDELVSKIRFKAK